MHGVDVAWRAAALRPMPLTGRCWNGAASQLGRRLVCRSSRDGGLTSCACDMIAASSDTSVRMAQPGGAPWQLARLQLSARCIICPGFAVQVRQLWLRRRA
jgi:hypothetical protein